MNQNRSFTGLNLDALKQKLESRSQQYLGYPAGRGIDYSALYSFLNHPLNNVGDPLIGSNDMQTKAFEQEVLSFFAALFRAPANNWWGYVTNGGSEGNLYALYLARELHPNGIVYYSEATHYSIRKNIDLLNMVSIVIRCNEAGEMDYEDLRQTIQFNRQKPVIVLANIGTTMTEAKDDLTKIRSILNSLAIKRSYLHADAALAGVYLALLEKEGVSFEHGADSITISGHKFLGTPVMSGVVLVKKNHKERIGRAIPYIGTLDTTISGSRNGITPLFLWHAIKSYGEEGLKNLALACLALAEYAESNLQAAGVAAWRNPFALTVVFPRPSQNLCLKWQLATEGNTAHIICMPGVTQLQLDEFIGDMVLDPKPGITCNIDPAAFNPN